MNNPIAVIVGPTASGKTNLAAHLAHKINGEIISADSRQVYKKLDLGTGKDLEEYKIENQHIPYHLIDICEAGEKYNLARFQEDFNRVYQEIYSRGCPAILCGGTGLYIQAVLSDFTNTIVPPNDDLRAELISKSREELIQILGNTSFNSNEMTHKRLIRAIEINKSGLLISAPRNPISYKIFGLNPDIEIRRNRISKRLIQRFDFGMLQEVENLLDSGVSADTLIYYGLEYKYITMYLLKQLSYSEMFAKLETEIHRYAKRQMTFFRSMEKKGFKINWLEDSWSFDRKIEVISSI